MIRVLFFDSLLGLSCCYAIARGGPPERIVGCALLAAYAGTLAAYSGRHSGFYHVEAGIFAVDILLLVVLVAVALCADRFWPLVLAGLQLDSVGAHLLKFADVAMIRVTYAVMIAVWSYPMLLALVVGTLRHRLRLRQNGQDLAWSIREPVRTD